VLRGCSGRLIDFRRRLSRTRRKLSTLGLAALATAGFATYVAGVAFFANERPSGLTRESPSQSAGAPVTPRFSESDYLQSRFPRLGGRPLIGVNYTHYGFRRCTFNGTGILASYHKPGVAQRVHAQLFRMRKAGVATIRTVIWHTTDATGQYWGPVSSAGGKLREPYRSNLIGFLSETRKFGFARLTVVFAPTGANNPLLATYEPAKFQENWQFIKSVRSLVKRYGPARTRLDLMSEGAPSETPSHWTPVPRQTGRYLRNLYRLYVKRFGNRDVTISTIAWDYTNNRLRNLVRILKSSGQPLPRWYDIRIGYDPATASYTLRNADAVLNGDQQNQPLVVGETAYDNRGVAKVITEFLQTSARRIDEVSPWFQRTPKGCPIRPPYRPGAYGRELHAQ
jgi:hypothetical protein